MSARELIIVSSLPLGGANTVANNGLSDHYPLVVPELAAIDLLLYGAPADPVEQYELSQKFTPQHLVEQVNREIKENQLSDIALHGCVTQAQVAAVRAYCGENSIDSRSIYVDSPRLDIFRSFLSRYDYTKLDAANPLVVNEFLDRTERGGLADIRLHADGIYNRGQISGNMRAVMEKLLTSVATFANE